MSDKSPDDPKRFYDLTQEEQSTLLQWIYQNISPRKTFYTKATSYGLKHRFENHGGFYVMNGVFKGAMQEAGYTVKNPDDPNWFFNISARSKCLKRMDP